MITMPLCRGQRKTLTKERGLGWHRPVVFHSLTKRPRCKQWTDVQMVAAMNAVKNRKMDINEAARVHGIPTTVLKDRVSGRVTHGNNLD